MQSIIEIFINGAWTPAAEFAPAGQGPYTGTFEYLTDYVFGASPVPISLALPVSAERMGIDDEGRAPPCPPFLLDLVPQGRGRVRLAQELGLPDTDRSDLVLAQHGAFNPIGALRLDTATAFYRDHVTKRGPQIGQRLTLDDIVTRRDVFLEHIWVHAMFAAGTTGVQGAAPKFLLTQDKDGLWAADAELPDDAAAKHWLVKCPRGRKEEDEAVLRNECAYLAVAERCGLRTGGASELHGNMLFIQRFDRVVTDAAGHSLQRLHQESLASLCGIRGFGIPVSLFDMAKAIRRHATHPVAELAEFLKRDILNLALRNTDNHARNTAMQRTADGTVQLTPVFDLAPMYLDPEMIVRTCRWRDPDGREVQRLEDIVAALEADDGAAIIRELKAFQARVDALPAIMRESGVDDKVIEDCRPHIDAQLERLAQLPSQKHPRHG